MSSLASDRGEKVSRYSRGREGDGARNCLKTAVSLSIYSRKKNFVREISSCQTRPDDHKAWLSRSHSARHKHPLSARHIPKYHSAAMPQSKKFHKARRCSLTRRMSPRESGTNRAHHQSLFHHLNQILPGWSTLRIELCLTVADIQGYKELDQKGPTFLAGDQHEQINGIRFISSPLPLCVPLQVTNTNAAPPFLKLLRATDLA